MDKVEILSANGLYHIYESKAEDGNVVALRGLHVKVYEGEAVAVVGPSGSGKGTIASELASKLDFNYLDSGAIYRTLGIAVQKANVDFMNYAQITEIYNKSNITFEPGKHHNVI